MENDEFKVHPPRNKVAQRYWCVGYTIDGESQLESFIANKNWKAIFRTKEDASQLKDAEQLRKGDIIILKTSYTKGAGHNISVLNVPAVGKATGNAINFDPQRDGYQGIELSVDYFNRERYTFEGGQFGSYRNTIKECNNQLLINYVDSLIKKTMSRIDIYKNLLEHSYNLILTGAPGTGKSYKINDETKSYSTIRTTFHPDSDYSTFVGAYKPTMEEMQVLDTQTGKVTKEKRITYTFVKQAFLKAYLGAWKKYAKDGEMAKPQFLVIEEINRGNCAQIFGDLFQLLDRSDNGFSTYPIEADSDLQNEISKAFADDGEYALESELEVDDAVKGYTSNYGKTLSDDIKSGRVLLLPNNLYIRATMNTSDQSLFPIDSAFKRRWDWQYVKIADAHKGWKIKCGDEYCDWWTFIEEINKKIAKETSSDDKKLGYFFCKPSKDGDIITEEKFVGKVLFYLWNDVFKDGDITLFKVNDEPEAEICFDAFYSNDNKVNVEAIRKFLVGVVGEENLMSKDDVDDEALEASIMGGNVDRSRYTFNGTGKYWKSTLGQKIIDTYLSQPVGGINLVRI